jgi:hypothetical protein
VEIAKRIAKAIRFSSGGFRYVKSMGVPLASRNLAQVSMNLTDFEQTPIHRVFEAVRAEAARYGAAIVGSEIVGLIPKRALEMTADRARRRIRGGAGGALSASLGQMVAELSRKKKSQAATSSRYTEALANFKKHRARSRRPSTAMRLPSNL